MANASLSGATPDPSFKARVTNIDSRLARVERLMANKPKIPAAASGGIVGVSRAEMIDQFEFYGSGFGGAYASGWTVSELWGGAGAGVSQDPADSSRIVVGVAGWYSVNASWSSGWFPTVPTQFTFGCDYLGDPNTEGFYSPEQSSAPTILGSGSGSVDHWLAFGPVHLEAGAWIRPSAGWNSATDLKPSADAHVDVTLWA